MLPVMGMTTYSIEKEGRSIVGVSMHASALACVMAYRMHSLAPTVERFLSFFCCCPAVVLRVIAKATSPEDREVQGGGGLLARPHR